MHLLQHFRICRKTNRSYRSYERRAAPQQALTYLVGEMMIDALLFVRRQ